MYRFPMILALFTMLSCNKPPQSPPPPREIAVVEAAVTIVDAGVAAGNCTTDADCRLWPSYCDESPCACFVLGKGEAEKKCKRNVTCFVDPCMRKKVHCESGSCTLDLSK